MRTFESATYITAYVVIVSRKHFFVEINTMKPWRFVFLSTGRSRLWSNDLKLTSFRMQWDNVLCLCKSYTILKLSWLYYQMDSRNPNILLNIQMQLFWNFPKVDRQALLLLSSSFLHVHYVYVLLISLIINSYSIFISKMNINNIHII